MQLLLTIDGACVWSVRDCHNDSVLVLVTSGVLVYSCLGRLFFIRMYKKNPKFIGKLLFQSSLSFASRSFNRNSHFFPSSKRHSTLSSAGAVNVCTMNFMRIYNALTGSVSEVNPDEFLRYVVCPKRFYLPFAYYCTNALISVADLKAWIQRTQNIIVDSQLLLTSRAVQLKLESMSYGVSIFKLNCSTQHN